ncbi:MAG: hypothetical protein KatS3mg039_0809 [Candidatus Kapaibacterium sp.]|nr:MAG: hypothetical protein KatS3mg039_0809 [Candidatus Kapabacteria bacterium]
MGGAQSTPLTLDLIFIMFIIVTKDNAKSEATPLEITP